ncbi:hypothetical protein ACIBLA_21800 [Streptomyces sp. NPDC050433]|uniref:hypothetical protein n=1 Tax=unclassified Streptomyces TaxID=2593676 RepID=UPI003425D5E6
MTEHSAANRNANGTAAKVKSSARAAEKSAEASVRSAGEATRRAATAGWESGRQAVTSTAGKAATKATTAWTVVKHRKAVAAGAAAGVVGLAGGAFMLGRRTARPRGPLSRLTRGRI